MNCLYRRPTCPSRPPCSPQFPCSQRPPCPRPLPASPCRSRHPCKPKTRMIRRCPSAEYPPCPRPRVTSRGCSPGRSRADVSINTCVPSYEADTFSSVMKKAERFSCGHPECPAFPVCRHAKCCPACEATPKSSCYYPPTLPEPSAMPNLRFSSSSCGVPVKRACGVSCRRKYQILTGGCEVKPPTVPCCYKVPGVCSRGCKLCRRCKRCMPPSCDPCAKLCPKCAAAKRPVCKPCDNLVCAKCAAASPSPRPPVCKSCGDPCPKLCPGCAAAKKPSVCESCKCAQPPPVCKPQLCSRCAASCKSVSCPKLCAQCASVCKPCKKPSKPCLIPDSASSQECSSEPCVIQKIYKTVFPPSGVTNYQQINIKVNQPPKGAPETKPLEMPYRDVQALHKCGGCGKLKLRKNPCRKCHRQSRSCSGCADVFGPDPIMRIPAVQTSQKDKKGAKVKRCLVC